MTRARKMRIAIVDDHPIVRMGLKYVIEKEPDLEVCGEADDHTSAMEGIKRWNADLIIVDISLKTGSGIDLIKAFHEINPSLLILVVSMHDEEIYAERSLRAGAKGYVRKDKAMETVVQAIRKVLAHEIYLSDEMSSGLLNKAIKGEGSRVGRLNHLSDREIEVFRLIGRGRSMRQIAEELHLSVKTVQTYRDHLKKKLNCDTSLQLVRAAFHWSKQI